MRNHNAVCVGGVRHGVEWLVTTTADGYWHVRIRIQQREVPDGPREIILYDWFSFQTHAEAASALDDIFAEAKSLREAA